MKGRKKLRVFRVLVVLKSYFDPFGEQSIFSFSR